MIRSFLGAVPPLRPVVRGFATAARTTDAPKASVAAVYDASEVAATIPGFEFPSAWCEDEVKDTPYAKRVAEPPVNMWALPSVAALYADLNVVPEVAGQMQACVPPAFAPASIAALHRDLALVHALSEADAKATAAS